MRKLADADGEPIGPDDSSDLHFEQCENCRIEFEQMRATEGLLLRQIRSEHDVDLWPAITREIQAFPKRRIGWVPFGVLGALLAGAKLLEMLPARDLGLAFKLVPVAAVVVLFFVIRENPFRVNSDLLLEK